MKCFGSDNKTYRCKIILLDETELIQEIQSTFKGLDILNIVFKHLSLLETVYFGLRFINLKGQSFWLESSKNVIKQIDGIEPITFYFGVKFYASDPCKLVEEATRYQFFLQVKQDIQQSRLSITNELAAQLLAFVIQSELGDYDPRTHQFGYVSEFRLIQDQSPEFENKVCDLHKKLIGQIPSAVELQFLERIKWLDLYGCELHSVVAEDDSEYFLGLGPHGLIVLKNKFKVGNYFWPRIKKVNRKGRFFMIKVIDKNNEQNTYGFEMHNKQASKNIYSSCKKHQDFFILSQNGVNLKNANSKSLDNVQSTFNRPSVQKGDRPTPSLIRVPSRRYQRMGRPDGSDGKGDINIENKSCVTTNGMARHNSALSLHPIEFPNTKHSNSHAQYEFHTGKNRERGMFSKSANASPLSVRSAFVSRYDYGRNNYVSHMKRNSSYSNLQKTGSKNARSSDNDSQVSKSSRYSRNSSRSHKCRHSRQSEDSGTESDSSKKRRHRRHRGTYEEPKLVDWNQILEKPNGQAYSSNMAKHSSAIVRNVTGYTNPVIDCDPDTIRQHSNPHLVKQTTKSHCYPSEVKNYIQHEPIDISYMSENEKKDIKFTKIESESKPYKFHQTNNPNGAHLKKPDRNLYSSSHKNLLDCYADYNSNEKVVKSRMPPGSHLQSRPQSIENITDCYPDKDNIYPNNYYPNYNLYPDYYHSQMFPNGSNSSQIVSSQSVPRVTFQPTHSTAYFSTKEAYKGTLMPKLPIGLNDSKIKTREMSTEL